MPKLEQKDQEMFNLLIRCQHSCMNNANYARLRGWNETADWYLNEFERCSRHMEEILSNYEEPKIITEYINETRIIGTKEYVERMRKSLNEKTITIKVVIGHAEIDHRELLRSLAKRAITESRRFY
jgi:hypothetical protein